MNNKKEELKQAIFRRGSFEIGIKKESTNRTNTISISSWVEIPEEKENMNEDEMMYRKAVIKLHEHYWNLYEEILKNIPEDEYKEIVCELQNEVDRRFTILKVKSETPLL